MSDTYSTSAPPGDDTSTADDAGGSEQKASQQEVNYRAGTPIKNCGLCGQFTGSAGEEANGCETVDGNISAFGYCDIYVKQPNPFGDQHQYSMGPGGQIAPAPAAGPPPGLRIGNRAYGPAG